MSRVASTTPSAINAVYADVDDDEAYGVDFTSKLPYGVTVTSAEIEQANDSSVAALTVSTPTINETATDITDDDGNVLYTVAIGKLVQFDIDPPTNAAEYRIKVKATCSDTKVRAVVCRLTVTEGLAFA